MSFPCALLIAASTRSFGMFTLLAFAKQRRKAGLVLGSGPPALTAIEISFPIRLNCLAIRSQRANMVDFLTSNILPMTILDFSPRSSRGADFRFSWVQEALNHNQNNII